MATMVDVIAGTSTGGIIACGLALPDPMPAAEIAAIYEVDGPSIFDRSAVKIVTLGQRLPRRALRLRRAWSTRCERHLGTTRLDRGHDARCC